jgi:hypothetical protein
LTPRLKLAAAIMLLVSAVASTRLPLLPLLAFACAALCAHASAGHRFRHILRSAVPIGIFVAGVAALQWFHGSVDWVLPLRTVAVFLLSTLAMRVAPWEWMAARLSPRSRLYAPGLFLLFVRHFTAILIAETQRTMQARAMCAPFLLRPGGFSSLVYALTAIFRRALTRAERFYAARTLNGIVR